MLTPVPTRVDDAKDAVLWSIFDRLQKIDENQGTRQAFATTLIYNSHLGLNDQAFSSELAQIREVLNIPISLDEEVRLVDNVREFDEPTLDQTMRDDI